EGDSEFAARGQRTGLRISRPQRVFRLQRGYRVDTAGASDRLGCCLRKSEISNFSRFHEFRHGADGLFNRRFSIHVMLIVEVDDLDAQTLQRRVAGPSHVLRPAIDAEKLAVFGSHVAKFFSQETRATPVAYRASDEPLVLEWTVDVCGVEEVNSNLNGPMNGGNRSRLVGAAV